MHSFLGKRKRMSDDGVDSFGGIAFVRLMQKEWDKRRSIIEQQPSDLLLNIFLLLSVTDLLSLKAVCKTFHQLISSDLFVRRYLKDFTKYPKATTAFIISTNPTASNLNYEPEKRTISVCHDESRFYYLGYLLVQTCDRLWLCNPITRSFRFLPSIYGFSLDFCCWKIAYDDVLEQYKMFGLRIWKNKVCLYVFDVRKDGKFYLPRKTTTAMEVGFDQMDSLIKGGVLVNGNLYWLIITPQTWRSCIVSANVTTEEVKTRNCHDTPFTIRSIYDNFYAANETFYLCRSFDIAALELWVLEGVESENLNPRWMMKHQIGLSSIVPTPVCQTRVLGVFRDKLLFIIVPSQQCYQFDLSKEKLEYVGAGDYN